MARWRRRPPRGQTVVDSDRGSQYTAWAFGQRLYAAELLGPMGRVVSARDSAMMESFVTLKLELLDSRVWSTRPKLARRSSRGARAGTTPGGDLGPVDHERRPAAAAHPA